MKNGFPLTSVLNLLKNHSTFVLLESSLPDKENHFSYIFINPLKVIRCQSLSQIKHSFEKLQKAKNNGYYLCGFVSYEAGYAFSSKSPPKQNYRFPLLWMGVFKKPLIYDHIKNSFDQKLALNNSILHDVSSLTNLRLNISRLEYINNIKRIKKLIESGDTYQVNYTAKYKFDFHGSCFALYQKLRDNQQVSYGAFIKSPGFSILSFSPELFFRQDKNKIYVRPMKGTMPRGINQEEDLKIKNDLQHDPKNRAENIMIVDLLRNDLGKISQTGSVKVTKLFSIEKYKTLLQMTSTVESNLKPGICLWDLFASLFPSGSVTGAPKIRTMEIINNLEPEERKIYTGTIGYFSPKQEGVFNVAIRTLLLEKTRGEMGVGSGITYSSEPHAEFKECKLKAQFLSRPVFKLIETMLWSKKKGVFLLEFHLKRLRRSADFFGLAYTKSKIISEIRQATKTLSGKLDYRLRLLLNPNGTISIKSSPLTSSFTDSFKYKVRISPHRINPDNIFLYHKTTNRSLYDREHRKYIKRGYFDVIFLNTRDEITEGAISTVFIKKQGVFYTPSLFCGVLPGVFREYFMSKHRRIIKEKALKIRDLQTADKIYCANSVRGMVEVSLGYD